MFISAFSSLAAALALTACAPPAAEGTGGTDVAPTAFGRGVFTVNTDYQSTNVSLVGLDGSRLSQSFISSALSPDVAAPSMPSGGNDIVLVDRRRSIVSWVDVRTAEIRTQVHADDARAEDPWDYLPVAADKAYVLRYQPAGGEKSGDVIVVNPETATVTTPVEKRIGIAAGLPAGYGAYPTRGVVRDGVAYVTLVVATSGYDYSSSYAVAIDTATDAVVATRELGGLYDCLAIALSPNGEELAIGCLGDLQADGPLSQAHAGVVLLSRADLSERARFEAPALGKGTPGFTLSYAAERRLVVTMLGNLNAGVDDTAVDVDLDSGKVREIHRAAPVQIGAVLCPARMDGKTDAPQDPPACFLTDADKGVLLRYPVENGTLGEPTSIDVDDVVGLPPRYLGQF